MKSSFCRKTANTHTIYENGFKVILQQLKMFWIHFSPAYHSKRKIMPETIFFFLLFKYFGVFKRLGNDRNCMFFWVLSILNFMENKEQCYISCCLSFSYIISSFYLIIGFFILRLFNYIVGRGGLILLSQSNSNLFSNFVTSLTLNVWVGVKHLDCHDMSLCRIIVNEFLQ